MKLLSGIVASWSVHLSVVLLPFTSFEGEVHSYCELKS